jgi:hypothetical protein
MNRAATLLLVVASFAFAVDDTDLVREAALGSAVCSRRRTGPDERAKGPARYESFAFSDVKIRFYGKAAVLTAYCDVKMTGQDSFRVRTLQVYTESNGQWQMAAHQSTRVARPF